MRSGEIVENTTLPTGGERLTSTAPLLVVVILLIGVLCGIVVYGMHTVRECINSQQQEQIVCTTNEQEVKVHDKGAQDSHVRKVEAQACSVSKDNYAVFQDEDGNSWEAWGRIEEGTSVILWITDNHTAAVEDDVIISIWYK